MADAPFSGWGRRSKVILELLTGAQVTALGASLTVLISPQKTPMAYRNRIAAS